MWLCQEKVMKSHAGKFSKWNECWSSKNTLVQLSHLQHDHVLHLIVSPSREGIYLWFNKPLTTPPLSIYEYGDRKMLWDQLLNVFMFTIGPHARGVSAKERSSLIGLKSKSRIVHMAKWLALSSRFAGNLISDGMTWREWTCLSTIDSGFDFRSGFGEIHR